MSNNQKPVPVAYYFREAEIPEPTERVAKGGWVTCGKNNLYQQEMAQLYYESPIHQGIINTKRDFVTNGGITVVGVDEEQAKAIHKNGLCEYDLDELVEQLELDLEIQEYFVLLFKKHGNKWCVDTLSAELCRPSEDLRFIHYSENWIPTSQTPEKYNYKVYPTLYNTNLNDPLVKEVALYVKSPAKQMKVGEGRKAKLTTQTYPIVRYSGCIPLIQADIEMNYFHFSESVNGFTSGHILNMNNGEPESDEKKRKRSAEIKGESSDRKSKGGLTIVWNDGKEQAAEFITMNGNNNDVRYLATQEYIRQEVLIGHSVQNAALFALETAGKLGNTTDLEKAYLRLMDTWGSKRRKQISNPIEEGLNKLNGTNIALEWDESIPRWIKDRPEPESTFSSKKPEKTKEEQENEIAQLFAAKGRSREDVTILHSRGFDYEASDSDYIADFISHRFQIDLTERDQRILQLISKGESWIATRDAVGMDSGAFAARITTLKNEGLISEWALTDQGKESVAEEELIEVVYTYELRPDVSGPAILPDGRTRSFCENLIKLNRVYTRLEIDSISAAVNRDVWLYRGGWWNDDGVNKPSCRHFWKQNIILR